MTITTLILAARSISCASSRRESQTHPFGAYTAQLLVHKYLRRHVAHGLWKLYVLDNAYVQLNPLLFYDATKVRVIILHVHVHVGMFFLAEVTCGKDFCTVYRYRCGSTFVWCSSKQGTMHIRALHCLHMYVVVFLPLPFLWLQTEQFLCRWTPEADFSICAGK